MNKRVKFEDNIFILMTRIRMIRDIIALDADPELFLEKTLDDIHFTDQSLKLILEYLRENHFLLERVELLEHFTEVEWQFSQVLLELLNHNGNFSAREVPSIQEKLKYYRNSSLDRQKTAENLSPATSSPGGDPLVSSDELTELLKAY